MHPNVAACNQISKMWTKAKAKTSVLEEHKYVDL